jgi:hypothetical protein
MDHWKRNVEYLIYVLIIVHMATTELINDNTIRNKRALLRPPALSVGRGQQTNQKKARSVLASGKETPSSPLLCHPPSCPLVPSLSHAPVAPTIQAVACSSGGRC